MSIFKKSPYYIAEIGVNHNGSIEQALTLMQQAKESGVDAVKFQKRDLDSLYTPEVLDDPNSQEWSFQYLIPQLRELELSHEDFVKLRAAAKDLDLDFIVTPFDHVSLQFCLELGVDAFKMASADLVYWPLMEAIAKTGKPFILSTGMWDKDTITRCVNHVKQFSTNFVVLHCQSTYPAPDDNLNLNFLNTLKDIWPNVGYSSHDRGTLPCLLAFTQGASIIEKHITADTAQLGPDHKASATPAEFKEMIDSIERAKVILGNSEKVVNQAETLNKELFAKSAYLIVDKSKGDTISLNDVQFLSPGKGLFSSDLENYIGKPLQIEKKIGELLTKEDFGERLTIDNWPRFEFNREWGVKCRFHDFNDYDKVDSKFVEFHCSDKDLDFNGDIGNSNKKLVIHAPEILDKDLLDLCSANTAIQDKSIDAIRETIKLTKKVHTKFSQSSKPKIVVHLGGMSLNEMTPNLKTMMTQAERFLKTLDLSEVELMPENLPPRPWYLGGQWYQYAFCTAEDMLQFCRSMGLGMTLDICHAQLWCKYAGHSLLDYVETVMPVVSHVHLSDALGIDGEGLQFGEGEIDFDVLMRKLEKKTFSWVPEIWSGHCHGGIGNYHALCHLKKYEWL